MSEREQRLQAIRERTEKATVGPWAWYYNHDNTYSESLGDGKRIVIERDCDSTVPEEDWVRGPGAVSLRGPDGSAGYTQSPSLPKFVLNVDEGSDNPADMELLGHARSDIPWLLAEIERLEREPHNLIS
jgi:hypothetical protein